MPGPFLTIGVPTYQRVDRLVEQLKSLLVCLPGEAEILVSDNGSTDGTAEAVLALAGRNPRVRLIRTSCNLGPDVNFLRIIEEATGTWCWLVGDDDPVNASLLPSLCDALRSCTAAAVQLLAPDAHLESATPREFWSAQEFIEGFYDIGRFSYLSCHVLKVQPAQLRLRAAYATCGRLHAYTAVALGLIADGAGLAIIDVPIVEAPPIGRRPRWNPVRAHLGAWTTLRDSVPVSLWPQLDQRAAQVHSKAIILGVFLHLLGLRDYDLRSTDFDALWQVAPWQMRLSLAGLKMLNGLVRWPRFAALAVLSMAFLARGRRGPSDLASLFVLPVGEDPGRAIVKALRARASGREQDAWEEA